MDGGGAHHSPFPALPFPGSKSVPIYCWVKRVFQLSNGQTRVQSYYLPETFCTMSKHLYPVSSKGNLSSAVLKVYELALVLVCFSV